MSRLYQLMRSGELKSYRDGRSRRVLMKSIKDRVNRLAATDRKWKPLAVKPPRRAAEA
jgi:hypothetical protein